jgi:hypothetical protein
VLASLKSHSRRLRTNLSRGAFLRKGGAQACGEVHPKGGGASSLGEGAP